MARAALRRGLIGRVRGALSALVALALVAACSRETPAPAASGTQQPAAATELRLGFFPNLTHAQALYGRATGEYEKRLGVPIRWVPFNAGPTAIEAMFAGAIDATYIGPSPTINGFVRSRGQRFVVVAGAASGGAGLVVRKGSRIRSERDFAGKTIATPQLGNTQDIAARVWLAERKYKLKEQGGNVSVLPLANPDQLAMFQRKQIDGAWTVEPWLARLELEGGGRLFLDEKALWPEGRYVTTHLIVSRQFLAANPDLVRWLIEAHVAVTQAINADEVAAGRIINEQIAKETSKPLPARVIERALGRIEYTWDPIASSLRRSAQAANEIGFLREPPRLEGLYSLDTLNAVLREQGLPEVRAE